MSAHRDRRRSAALPPPPVAGRRSVGGFDSFDSFLEGWRTMPAVLVVLRLFLGVTFVYAGAQKLLDPNFLRSGSSDYIGTQLRGFAQGSPISWLLDPLAHVAVLAGLGIALLEISIGLGTLIGIAPRTMAGAGFLVNLALLLSATWHVHPYFLGSDSVYAVAWAAYFVGYAEHARRSRDPRFAAGVSRSRHASSTAIGRRELLRGATLAGVTLATGIAARALSGTRAAATLAAAGSGTPMRSATTTRTGKSRTASSTGSSDGSTSSAASTSTQRSVSGTPVAKLSSVPVGGAIGFQAPGGTPAALVRLGRSDVVAYSRVCTHAGCLVGYDTSQRILYCPCHGAEYDPARGGAVIGGPAPRPLPEIPVEIDPSTGEVVVPNA
jgi:thiosulfate dehydrogenase [quinone] large subunit